MIRTRQALAVAGAAALLICLAACTARPNAPSAAPVSATPPFQSNDRSYTKADLGSILTSVNTQLKLRGNVETQGGPPNPDLDSLRAAIGSSATFTPASCAALIKSDVQLGSQGVVGGTLTSSQLNLIVSTVAGAALPPALMSGFTSTQTAILSTCKQMTITGSVDGQDVSVKVDFTPFSVKTDASQSVGFTEKVAITGGGGSSTSTRTAVEAVDGNLLLLASGVSVQDGPGLVKAIDAAVAAGRH